MASKLALRTLGAVALPGALLAMAAPAASAAELAPLSGIDQGGVTEHTDDTTGGTGDPASDVTGLLNGQSFEF